MNIGTHSDSYPYLALARRLGVDYGAVLWLVDALEKRTSTLFLVLTDDKSLTAEQKVKVHEEYVLELERRRARA